LKTIQDIFRTTDFRLIKGNLQQEIKGLAFDSRKVEEGFAFFAIRGTQTDGHQYVNQAISKGASLIVAEETDKNWEAGAIIQVADSNLALSLASSAFYDFPSEKLNLIGVTGTNGKTTTVTLLYHLFKGLGYSCGLISTIRVLINDKEYPATHTTPDPVQLNSFFRQMADENCSFAFMEVSSHAIAQKRINGLAFKGGIFTNITHDHLDYHLTFRNYLETKKKFFDNLDKTAFSLVNADDRNSKFILQNTLAVKKTFGLKNPADFKAKIIENSMNGLHLKIDDTDFYSEKPGVFNAYNLLGVYAAAVMCGEDKYKILELLSRPVDVDGRFQLVFKNPQYRGIVDYAHTPDALENVLKTISNAREKTQKIITVFGCGGNRDKTKRPEMGKISVIYSDKVIVTSDNPRDEDPQDIINNILEGIPSGEMEKVLVIADREQAIKTACMLAQSGDIILLAGKGHETYQEIKGVKHHFDDREILLKYLKS